MVQRGADLGRSSSPGDTYDVVDQRTPEGRVGPSLGVVDDTCEVHFSVVLTTSIERSLDARAVAFVGPPDFAPDRRPFLSVADEINDRCGDAATRNAAMDEGQLDRWVEDLFERIYETVSCSTSTFTVRSAPGPTAPPNCRRTRIIVATRTSMTGNARCPTTPWAGRTVCATRTAKFPPRPRRTRCP